jgi:hypothetical protein
MLMATNILPLHPIASEKRLDSNVLAIIAII